MTVARDGANAAWVKVWDPVIRVFHWGLAAAVILALISNENRSLHEAAGYVALALIVIRVAWGFLGSRQARFSSFVQPPGAILAYLRDITRFRARRYLGHNPAGGAMILLLMATVATAGVSGWLSETDRFFAVAWVEDLHRAAGNLMIALIVLHLIGVLLSSLMHGENLVRAMITGRKPIAPRQEDDPQPAR